MITELLKWVCGELDGANIPYMVTGGIAMGAYTVPRNTLDIDIIIELKEEHLEKFFKIFESDFYLPKKVIREELKLMGMFNVIDHKTGHKIDFVIKKDSEFRELEFSRRQRSDVLGFDAWIITLEDLIISKLIWIQQLQSERQMNDIRSLWKNPSVDRAYVREWVKNFGMNTFNLLEP